MSNVIKDDCYFWGCTYRLLLIYGHIRFVSLLDCLQIIASAEREVKDSRRTGMYQSYQFLTRLGMESL